MGWLPGDALDRKDGQVGATCVVTTLMAAAFAGVAVVLSGFLRKPEKQRA